MKLEVGKEYRSEAGDTVQVILNDGTHPYPFKCSDGRWRCNDGRVWENGVRCTDDLIAPWPSEPTGPVRTVTRTTKEIVPGVYGKVQVHCCHGRGVDLEFPSNDLVWDESDIRAAIATLTEIADALEDGQ